MCKTTQGHQVGRTNEKVKQDVDGGQSHTNQKQG